MQYKHDLSKPLVCTVRGRKRPLLYRAKDSFLYHGKTIILAFWLLLTGWKADPTDAQEEYEIPRSPCDWCGEAPGTERAHAQDEPQAVCAACLDYECGIGPAREDS